MTDKELDRDSHGDLASYLDAYAALQASELTKAYGEAHKNFKVAQEAVDASIEMKAKDASFHVFRMISETPNMNADIVRAAEEAFLASERVFNDSAVYKAYASAIDKLYAVRDERRASKEWKAWDAARSFS